MDGKILLLRVLYVLQRTIQTPPTATDHKEVSKRKVTANQIFCSIVGARIHNCNKPHREVQNWMRSERKDFEVIIWNYHFK